MGSDSNWQKNMVDSFCRKTLKRKTDFKKAFRKAENWGCTVSGTVGAASAFNVSRGKPALGAFPG
jgi:hypothetical protein